MAIKTNDLNARLFGKADKRRATTVAEAQSAAKDKAAVIELAVAGETTVAFELVKVKASEIGEQTQVFAQNAREQAFFKRTCLSRYSDNTERPGTTISGSGSLAG